MLPNHSELHVYTYDRMLTMYWTMLPANNIRFVYSEWSLYSEYQLQCSNVLENEYLIEY